MIKYIFSNPIYIYGGTKNIEGIKAPPILCLNSTALLQTAQTTLLILNCKAHRTIYKTHCTMWPDWTTIDFLPIGSCPYPSPTAHCIWSCPLPPDRLWIRCHWPNAPAQQLILHQWQASSNAHDKWVFGDFLPLFPNLTLPLGRPPD